MRDVKGSTWPRRCCRRPERCGRSRGAGCGGKDGQCTVKRHTANGRGVMSKLECAKEVRRSCDSGIATVFLTSTAVVLPIPYDYIEALNLYGPFSVSRSKRCCWTKPMNHNAAHLRPAMRSESPVQEDRSICWRGYEEPAGPASVDISLQELSR